MGKAEVLMVAGKITPGPIIRPYLLRLPPETMWNSYRIRYCGKGPLHTTHLWTRNPSALATLRNEIRNAYTSPDATVGRKERKKCRYLKSCDDKAMGERPWRERGSQLMGISFPAGFVQPPPSTPPSPEMWLTMVEQTISGT